MWKSSDSGVFTYFAWQPVVLVQAPRLESEHAPTRVGEREQQAALEVVAAALARQSGGAQLVGREPLLDRLARQRVAAEREAEPELAADLLVRGRGPAR